MRLPLIDMFSNITSEFSFPPDSYLGPLYYFAFLSIFLPGIILVMSLIVTAPFYLIFKLYKIISPKKLLIYYLGFIFVKGLVLKLFSYPLLALLPPMPVVIKHWPPVTTTTFQFIVDDEQYAPLSIPPIDLHLKALVIHTPHSFLIENIVSHIVYGLYIWIMCSTYFKLKGRQRILVFAILFAIGGWGLAYGPSIPNIGSK